MNEHHNEHKHLQPMKVVSDRLNKYDELPKGFLLQFEKAYKEFWHSRGKEVPEPNWNKHRKEHKK